MTLEQLQRTIQTLATVYGKESLVDIRSCDKDGNQVFLNLDNKWHVKPKGNGQYANWIALDASPNTL